METGAETETEQKTGTGPNPVTRRVADECRRYLGWSQVGSNEYGSRSTLLLNAT
jgi:hypothetical protein